MPRESRPSVFLALARWAVRVVRAGLMGRQSLAVIWVRDEGLERLAGLHTHSGHKT